MHRLTRIDTSSSVSTNATAPDLEGAGRTVGRLFEYLGNNLESYINSRLTPSDGPAQNVHVPLTPVRSTCSIDSNATAPNLEGAGRTVGLLLDRVGVALESVMKRQAVQLGYGPESVARDIRCLRHHNEVWIGRRYHDAIIGMPTMGKSEVKNLKKLCKKLLKYTRSHVYSTQLKALREVTTLAIEDPFVKEILSSSRYKRYFFPKYAEPDAFIATIKMQRTVKDARVHDLWSRHFILSCTPDRGGKEGEALHELICDEIEELLQDPDVSFLVARFISLLSEDHHSLAQDVWERYMLVAASNPHVIEWENINECIKNGVVNGVDVKFGLLYLQDHEQVDLYGGQLHHSLMREAIHLPLFFSSFFSIPDINIQRERPWMETREVDSRAEMVCHFLRGISGSDDLSIQIFCLRNLDPGTKLQLRSTVLLIEPLIAYYFLLYRFTRCTSILDVSSWIRSGMDQKKILLEACFTLVSYLCSNDAQDRMWATRLLSYFVSTNRYCKNITSYFLKELDLRELRVDMGLALSTDPFPLDWPARRNMTAICKRESPNRKWVLLRRRVNSEFIFRICTQEEWQEFKTSILNSRDIERMEFNEELVEPIRIDGRKAPFNTTGHYPILASVESGVERYVSIFNAVLTKFDLQSVSSEITKYGGVHVSSVAGGAHGMTFRTFGGRTMLTYDFFVLVLRHNPSDAVSLEQIPNDAIDPTGPLYWKRESVLTLPPPRVIYSGLEKKAMVGSLSQPPIQDDAMQVKDS